MKIIFAIVLSLISTSLLAYDIKLENQTDSTMTVTVEYSGSFLCSKDTYELAPKAVKTDNVGLCCANLVEFQATTGSYSPLTVQFIPPKGTFGTGCRDWSAKAMPATSKSFKVE